MGKENISATVDPEVSVYLEQDHVNTSGLVNRLLKRYVNGERGELAMLELRQDQLQSKIETLETQLETKQEQLERVNEKLERLKNEQTSDIDGALEVLNESNQEITKDNPAVQAQAENAGVDVDTLLNQYYKQ